MSAPLRPLPTPGPIEITGRVIGTPPPPGPADQVSLARVRRAVITHLGPVPNLDAHLGLLDARGAWYAPQVAPAWDHPDPEAFFGLVRHVVRTQMPGPAPVPDVEGWITAGRPADAELAFVWDRMRVARYPFSAPPVTHRDPGTGHPVDEVVRAWPVDHGSFIVAYTTVEATLDLHRITLPAVTG